MHATHADDRPEAEPAESFARLVWTIHALTGLKEGAMLAARAGARLPGASA